MVWLGQCTRCEFEDKSDHSISEKFAKDKQYNDVIVSLPAIHQENVYTFEMEQF